MEGQEELKSRRDAMKRKTRIYLYSGYMMLVAGIALLSLTRWGFVIVAAGIVLRVLYYISAMDLRALDKLSRRMGFLSIAFVVSLFFLPLILSALDPGETAPDISGLEWLRGGSPMRPEGQHYGPGLTVVTCVLSSDRASVLSLPLLSVINDKYSKRGVFVAVMSKEGAEVLEEFLEGDGKEIAHAVIRDPSGSVVDTFHGDDPRVPLSLIIGDDGKVVWRGHPMQIDTVLRKIISGKFDLKAHERIFALHQQLQQAMNDDRIRDSVAISERILSLDPADDIAMRIRLFFFENTNDLDGAREFIERLISDNPHVYQLYMVKLDILLESDASGNQIGEFSKDAFAKFADNWEALQHLAWLMLNRVPVPHTPVVEATDAAKKAVELLERDASGDHLDLARALNTLARAYYLCGAPELAAEKQREAVSAMELRRSASGALLAESRETLDFYLMLSGLRAGLQGKQK
ncbi:MAG: hypothetical protein JW808_05565 [Victivallales bacterium]|nr:hypothetical protein [Victivallales bacterium]